MRRLDRRCALVGLPLFLALTISSTKATGGELTVTWVNNASDALGYSVERSLGTVGEFMEVATTAPLVTTLTDVALAGGATYCYRVRAFNVAGFSGYSNVACGVASGVAMPTLSGWGMASLLVLLLGGGAFALTGRSKPSEG